jgi:hypothetical protein
MPVRTTLTPEQTAQLAAAERALAALHHQEHMTTNNVFTTSRAAAAAVASRALEFVLAVHIHDVSGTCAMFVVAFDGRVVLGEGGLDYILGSDGYLNWADVPEVR